MVGKTCHSIVFLIIWLIFGIFSTGYVHAEQNWVWPVSGAVITGFDFDSSNYYYTGQHRGIDIAAEPGTDVRAPLDGTVSWVSGKNAFGSGGMQMTIAHEGGIISTYKGLESVTVYQGSVVKQGDTIAVVGNQGDVESSDRPHLHLGVYLTSSISRKEYLNPLDFLPPPQLPVKDQQPQENGAKIPLKEIAQEIIPQPQLKPSTVINENTAGQKKMLLETAAVGKPVKENKFHFPSRNPISRPASKAKPAIVNVGSDLEFVRHPDSFVSNKTAIGDRAAKEPVMRVKQIRNDKFIKDKHGNKQINNIQNQEKPAVDNKPEQKNNVFSNFRKNINTGKYTYKRLIIFILSVVLLVTKQHRASIQISNNLKFA